MKKLLYKAALYSPDYLVDFILELEREMDDKALFRAILKRYFYSDTLSYPEEENTKLSNKNGD